MELTKKDRVLLINQYRILAALNKDEESYYKELIIILENGYEIFYPLIDQWVSEDIPKYEGRFVLNILDLYRVIESIKRTTKDQRILEHPFSIFKGFDGNNETEYMGFCRFLIEKQGKFQEQQQYLLRNDNLNSHMPMVNKYERMLTQSKLVLNLSNMSVDQVLQILEA